MLSPPDFRTAAVSLPLTEVDEVPACCFACPYNLSKEFSASEGAVYLYCCYNAPDRISQINPTRLVLEAGDNQ